MNIESIDELIKKYSMVSKIPCLSVYIEDKELFLENYIVINEANYISICNRKTYKTTKIPKDEAIIDLKRETIKTYSESSESVNDNQQNKKSRLVILLNKIKVFFHI